MKIYSWNVNGIRSVAAKGALKTFLDTEKPDIVGIQEIKSSEPLAGDILNEYHVYWNPAAKKGYSGTALITKIVPLNITYGFGENAKDLTNSSIDQYGDSTLEGRVITAEYESFYFVTVYTPNSKGDLTRLPLRYNFWDRAFLAHVKYLEQYKPVLFCGDLNVAHTEDDLANPKPNVGKHGFTHEERERFGDFLSAGYTDTFRMFTSGNGHYSWWTHFANARARNVGWRIDYMMASKKLQNHIKASRIHPDILGSDHCPVSVLLDI